MRLCVSSDFYEPENQHFSRKFSWRPHTSRRHNNSLTNSLQIIRQLDTFLPQSAALCDRCADGKAGIDCGAGAISFAKPVKQFAWRVTGGVGVGSISSGATATRLPHTMPSVHRRVSGTYAIILRIQQKCARSFFFHYQAWLFDSLLIRVYEYMIVRVQMRRKHMLQLPQMRKEREE